jgi:predicted ester cyclase
LREGVLGRAHAVHAAFRDVAVAPVDVVVDRDAVAWRFRLSGTHVGALGGIVATGRAVAVEGVTFQQVRDGVVVEHWTTVDLGPLRA